MKLPVSFEERKKIKQGHDLGLSYRELALHVGRCKSVVLRESKRLGEREDYDPILAQKNFESKQKLSGIKRGSEAYLKVLKQENLPYVESEIYIY